MLARLLYLFLLMIVARLLFRALAEMFGVRSGPGSSSRRVGGRASGRDVLVKGRMVRDPVCGLNLPEDRAIVFLVKGEPFHFCSERCRNDFAEKQGHERASA